MVRPSRSAPSGLERTDRPRRGAARVREEGWRREALRATLWFTPSVLVSVAFLLFGLTYWLDRLAYRGSIDLPAFVSSGSADAARQVLTAIAAAVITVAGLVFSITIVALTLASSQFGPRIIRNFIRDRGTQITLGVLVATFLFDVLALGSITSSTVHRDFVPHVSITVALGLLVVDLAVLIFFIHHVTKSIQLPQVMGEIGAELGRVVSALGADDDTRIETGPSLDELTRRLADDGADVVAATSGYLQFVGYRKLVTLAESSGGVIRMSHRAGHFVVAGRPLARVWPADRAPAIARQLAKRHVTGPHRTPAQDVVFTIDQLVEIAIRALSPAVNDTFTALTCIDWLGDGLARVSPGSLDHVVHRDAHGAVRVIEAPLTYGRLVKAAFDKIRQAGRGMPAVAIRQLDMLAVIASGTTEPDQRRVLSEQADMILRSSDESVPEASDRRDVRDRYERFAATLEAPA